VDLKSQCGSWGWTTRRKMKNVSRPCPKCGGTVYVHDDDQGDAMIVMIVILVIMALVGGLMVAFGVAEL